MYLIQTFCNKTIRISQKKATRVFYLEKCFVSLKSSDDFNSLSIGECQFRTCNERVM